MFKGLFYSAIVFVFLLLTMQPSFALSITDTTFTDTIDFSSTQGVNSYPYLEIRDSYSYIFTLTGLNSPGFEIDDATLSLRHMGNSNTNTDTPFELWYTDSGGNILIGQLSTSSDWVIDAWPLSSAVLTEIEGTNPWSLTVKLNETTNGADRLKIDWSTLSGLYSDPPPQQPSVPEPSTLLLLGAGLAGVGLLRRRFKK